MNPFLLHAFSDELEKIALTSGFITRATINRATRVAGLQNPSVRSEASRQSLSQVRRVLDNARGQASRAQGQAAKVMIAPGPIMKNMRIADGLKTRAKKHQGLRSELGGPINNLKSMAGPNHAHSLI